MSVWAIRRRNGGVDCNDALMDDSSLWENTDDYGNGHWVEVVPACELADLVSENDDLRERLRQSPVSRATLTRSRTGSGSMATRALEGGGHERPLPQRPVVHRALRPADQAQRQLRNAEIEELGFAKPKNEKQAQRIEYAAIDAWSTRRPNLRDETCDSFAERWADDFPKRRGRAPASTTKNASKPSDVRSPACPLRSITRDEARDYATEHFCNSAALRAMFTDALDAKPGG